MSKLTVTVYDFGECSLCEEPCSFTLVNDAWVCNCDCSEVVA